MAIPALDPDPESDLQVFCDSGVGFETSKNQTSTLEVLSDPELAQAVANC